MFMNHPTIDVCIPTYRPDEKLIRLLELLLRQSLPLNKIIIINTEQSIWDSFWENRQLPNDDRIEVTHISAEEFDHGATRRLAASKSDAEYMVMMTQDAVPYDETLISELSKQLELDANIAVAYARQLPNSDASPEECYVRSFNYPEVSKIKTKEDLPELGIKTFFCSNVCAMYRKSIYSELGGFVTKTIFNEDMIYAHKAIEAGYSICYCAPAKVLHSHNYSAMDQFHRNFDLAVSQAQHPEVFEGLKSEGEGMKLVKGCISYLRKVKKILRIPGFVWNCGWRFLGFKMGRKYKSLPGNIVLKFTSNKAYWK